MNDLEGNLAHRPRRFAGEWELTLYPATAAGKRRTPARWARTLLLGHGAMAAAALSVGWWMVPVVVSLAPCAGQLLFSLCNNTQHIGLQDNVADFRLCCRTFTLNPFVRFLYWHMNYHIEHHMYATTDCSRRRACFALRTAGVGFAAKKWRAWP